MSWSETRLEASVFELKGGGFFVYERSYLDVPAYPCNFVSQVFFAARFLSLTFEPTLSAYAVFGGQMMFFTGRLHSGPRTMCVRYHDLVTESPGVEVSVSQSHLRIDWPKAPLMLRTDVTTYEDARSTVYVGAYDDLHYAVVRKPKDYSAIHQATGVWVDTRVDLGQSAVAIVLIAPPLELFAVAVAALMAFIWRRTRQPPQAPREDL